jgi:hypothetical protein
MIQIPAGAVSIQIKECKNVQMTCLMLLRRLQITCGIEVHKLQILNTGIIQPNQAT